jgi:hypothetical protein
MLISHTHKFDDKVEKSIFNACKLNFKLATTAFHNKNRFL